ncbi:cytochrome c [Massilia sp. 9096]|uniref:cytochrome c n=1 Tax=Massilia sp. 9096 TaxID=1500894 RepID=UPI0009DF0385|nr:cytochrome c [Massilia sp. 9096]
MSMARMARLALLAATACAAGAIALAWPRMQMIPSSSRADWAATPDNIARGAYLARAGGCVGCHTARGGAAYAGGRALDTPFGRLVAPNITPDRATGIGAWSADDFWNALHNGIAPGGRLLYPAFPYPNYTRVTRADSDALFAYLRSLKSVRRPNAPHALGFPYKLQAALAAWRLLYFTPGVYAPALSPTSAPAPARADVWNRGAYLVEGLGHCGACHSARNAMGASSAVLDGGLMAGSGWYAPALTTGGPAGPDQWIEADLVQLLRSGVAPRHAVFGPMAEVVGQSLQHLSEPDLRAIAVYLRSLPAPPGRHAATAPAAAAPDALMKGGERLYARHCADCHGKDGGGVEGDGQTIYPPLAGNRVVSAAEPVNAIRIVLNGGFAPATAGNPRPYGMPPFSTLLDDEEAAAVISYVRASWGNAARAVTPSEVNANRAVPPD